MVSKNSANVVELATELTIAWLGNANNRVNAEDVPAFLKRMYDTISAMSVQGSVAGDTVEPDKEYAPAVSVRKSLASPDHIVSMIDGKPFKTLRRHLSSNGLTPDDYRARYGLKADYPMVAPSYSAARQEMAKKIGLGRKPGQKPSASAAPKGPKPIKAGEAKAAAKVHLGSPAE